MAAASVRTATVDELDIRTLYGILRLRVDVFVVEQACPYPELDGRDLEPTTEHVWAERDGEVLAYLRVLRDPDGVTRIGRVVTAAAARGRRLAGELLAASLRACGDRPVHISAQAHLERWYAGFGFVRTGPDFLEDGIPHLPMVRG